MKNDNLHTEIAAYLSGTMHQEQKLAFKDSMAKDPFLADAVEGYSLDPGALLDMPGTKISGFWQVLNLVPLLSVVAILAYFLSGSGPNLDESIELAPPVEAKRQENFFPISKRTATINAHELKPVLALPLARKEVYLQAIASVPAGVDARVYPRELQFRYRTGYFLDHKIYLGGSDIVKEPFPMVLGGTPANMSKREQQGQLKFIPERDSLNSNALKEALRFLSVGNNSGALEVLKSIDAEDVNALFYNGLAHYRLGNYEESHLMFKRAAKHLIPVFSEEAHWYMALSLEAGGRRNEAKEIFFKIKTAGGHYAQPAAEKLKITY